jgi:hypothetical protein
MHTPLLTIVPESVVPEAAVMTAVLAVTETPDIVPAMPSYRRRKIEIPDPSPWSTIVVSAVPAAITENVVGIPIVNDIIRPTIGYRQTIVIQIDEIRPAFEKKSGPAHANTHPNICA